MKRAALSLILIALASGPALAQGRGRNAQGVPPGHLPPDGSCRVWYEGVPPGRQPPPTDCDEAERTASRTRAARVIYGRESGRYDAPIYRDDRYPGDIRRGDRTGTDGRRPNPDGNRNGRAVPRGEQYPNSYPYPDARYPQRRGHPTFDTAARG